MPLRIRIEPSRAEERERDAVTRVAHAMKRANMDLPMIPSADEAVFQATCGECGKDYWTTMRRAQRIPICHLCFLDPEKKKQWL